MSVDGAKPELQDDEPLFVFGEVTHVPKFESDIPEDITSGLLAKAKEVLPPKLPLLGSTVIEDFITEKLDKGLTQTQVGESFSTENMPDVVSSYIDGVQRYYDEVDWGDVLSELDVREIQDIVTEEMRSMGIPETQVQELMKIRIELGERFGSSSAGDEMVAVSRMQSLRKAMDYIAVFPEVTLQEALKVITKTTVGHELGHHINNLVPGIAINKIPSEWKSKDGWSDNKGERFAEYWGRLIAEKIPGGEDLRRKEWFIHLTKVNMVWEALKRRNDGKTDQEKIDLYAIFRDIEDKLANDEDALELISARRGLYGGTEVECYASPYDRETIRKSVEQPQ